MGHAERNAEGTKYAAQNLGGFELCVTPSAIRPEKRTLPNHGLDYPPTQTD